MNHFNEYKEDIENCLKVLNAGGIILYPTDTIWGIGCDATNAGAVEKIFQLKKRHDSKAMLVLLDNENRLPAYVDKVPEVAWDLIELSEKPLTIIYPNAKNLASNIITEDGTVGIRISREEFSKNLIGRYRKPIVSTSANISGQASPSIFQDIADEIIKSVDYIVKFRQDDFSISRASSIVKLGVGGEIEILRK